VDAGLAHGRIVKESVMAKDKETPEEAKRPLTAAERTEMAGLEARCAKQVGPYPTADEMKRLARLRERA